MLINSFVNQSNLAEWFEHRNHYSVVVTRHKDLQRTEYKIQKNDYVYDMLKVRGSVTALVTCAKSLANNFPPTTTTDNKTVATGEQVGVVDSVGDAPLASVLSEQTNSNPSDIVVCGSGVNPPPVAVSSPAASDTPYKNMQSQRLGAAL
jgi:hypothetical protein